MTPEKLKKRMTRVQATPLPERTTPVSGIRRDMNHIEEEPVPPGELYESFFDYEKDMEDLETSAAEQFEKIKAEEEAASMEMEQIELEYDEAQQPEVDYDFDAQDTGGWITLEEKQEPIEEPDPQVEENVAPTLKEERRYDDVVGFEFVQCSFIMETGKQCRRQAPKGGDICSIHKRVIDKRKKK